MSLIDKRVSAARWRLWVNRYLHFLGTCLLWAGLAWFLVVLIKKIFGLNIPVGYAAGAAAAAAFLTAVVWLLLTAEDRLTAAIALDRAGAVKERLSTALYLRQSTDPFAQAAVADAERTASMLQVRNILPVRYPRPISRAALSWALAGLLVWLLPTYDVMGRMRAEERKKEQAAKAQQVIAQEVKKAQEVRERMKQKGLLTEDLKNKLDEMEAKMAELARNPEKMSVEPIKPMTSLKEQIKQDQGNLQQQLEGMQSALAKLSLSQMNKEGLVSKLSKELATGNFKDAKESMKELQAKIQEAAKDPAKAAELASDLAKLAAALQDQSLDNKLSNELKAAGLSDDQLNKLDQAMKQGKQLSEADMKDLKDAMKQQGLSESQATEMMQKLASAMKGAQMACQMGQALSDAAQCMKQGQGQQGSQGQQGQQGQGRQGSQGQGQQMAGGQGQSGGMGSAQQALSEMEALQAQALEMQALLADIQGTQGSMSSAEGQGQFGQGGNLNSSGAGMGRLGRGRGGVAPVQPGPTAMTPSKVKGTWQKGRMIGEYFDDSQQVKGESRSQLVEIVNAAQQEATKTIDEHKLPPQYDSTVERYFSELRQLDQQKKNPQPAQ